MTTFLEAVDGLMLGDASIPKKRAPYFTFAQAGKDREPFVLLVKKMLEDVRFSCKLDQKTRSSDGVYVSTIWTPVSEFWQWQRERFYPEERKIIPEDIHITPVSLYMLYLCDGSLGWAHGEPWVVGSSPWVELSTCSFSTEEVDFLGRFIVRRVGGIDHFSIKGSRYPRLYIGGRKQLRSFMDYILQGARVPCGFEYKFRGFL